jgi:pimeloyl-ACP methyl ester carboxylesterase
MRHRFLTRRWAVLLVALLGATGCHDRMQLKLAPGRMYLPPAAEACTIATSSGHRIEIFSSSRTAAESAKPDRPCGSFDMLAINGGPGEQVSNPFYIDLQRAMPELRIGFVNPPGLGGSTPIQTAANALEEHITALNDVMDQTLQEPRLLLGFSWGATLAAMLVARDPDHAYRVLLASPGELLLESAPPALCMREPGPTRVLPGGPCLQLEQRYRSQLALVYRNNLRAIARAFGLKDRAAARAFIETVVVYNGSLNQSVNTLIMLDYIDVAFRASANPDSRFVVLRGAEDSVRSEDTGGYAQVAPVIATVTIPGQGHVPEGSDCLFVTELRAVVARLDPMIRPRSCTNWLDPVPGMEGGFVRTILLCPPG